MTVQIGKFLILIGLFLIMTGIVFWLGPKIPWLGKLPGDFHFQGKNIRIIFPVATCLVLSILLTLILSIFGRR